MFWQLVFANAAIKTIIQLEQQTRALNNLAAQVTPEPHYSHPTGPLDAQGRRFCTKCGCQVF